MDEQPGQQATPQYSPDGKWWWDGQKWVAAEREPAAAPAGPTPTATPPSPKAGPGKPPVAGCAILVVLVALMGVCTVAVARSSGSQQGGKAGAKVAVATHVPTASTTSTPEPTATAAATATPRPITTTATARLPTPDSITGFGATDAAWDSKHRASGDSQLAAGCCYDADPALPQVNGHVGYRYYAVGHTAGRVLNYQIEEYRNTNYAEARAGIWKGEFPPDATILWEVTKDSCAQMEIQSGTLGAALAIPAVGDPQGLVFVEFTTGDGYDPNNITEVIVELGNYASPADAPLC